MFYNLNGQSVTDLKPDFTISVEEIKSLESRNLFQPTRNYRELYDRIKKFRESKSATIAFISDIQPPSSQNMWNMPTTWWSLLRYIDTAVNKRMALVLDKVYVQENLYNAFKERLGQTKVNVLHFDQSIKDAAKRKKEREALNKRAATNQAQLSLVMPVMIPEIGTKMVIAEDWHMTLFDEYRNNSILELTETIPKSRNWHDRYDNSKRNTEIVFPKGTILSVDRIYIRKGASDFSSLTFFADKKVKILRDGKEYVSPKALRFWAKLKDVNNMKVQFIEETVVK
jgi:hypothetical protein